VIVVGVPDEHLVQKLLGLSGVPQYPLLQRQEVNCREERRSIFGAATPHEICTSSPRLRISWAD